MEKKLYKITVYFGANEVDEIEEMLDSYNEAVALADLLCEEAYEDYAGGGGILTYDEVAEDLRSSWGEEPTEEEIWEAYMDEVRGWTHAEIVHIPTTSYKDIIS